MNTSRWCVFVALALCLACTNSRNETNKRDDNPRSPTTGQGDSGPGDVLSGDGGDVVAGDGTGGDTVAGDSDTTGDDDTHWFERGDPTPPESYVWGPVNQSTSEELYKQAICTRLVRCAKVWGPFYDLQECMESMFVKRDDRIPAYSDPEVYSVDSAKLTTCLDEIASAPCDIEFSPSQVSVCDEALTGLLGEGACCDWRGGCAQGLYCAHGVPVDGVLGTCQIKAGEGEACGEDLPPCGANLYCDGICKVPLELGGFCTHVEGQCGENVCMNNTCQKKPTLYEECTFEPEYGDKACGPYMSCVMDTGICEAKKFAGAPCFFPGLNEPGCSPIYSGTCLGTEEGIACNNIPREGEACLFLSPLTCANPSELACTFPVSGALLTCQRRKELGNPCEVPDGGWGPLVLEDLCGPDGYCDPGLLECSPWVECADP